MNSPSIYDDLRNTDLGEKVDKLKEQNEKLLGHIKSLEGDIEKLCKELTKMKRNEDNLKRNISSLYNTSKVEVERKDRMIAELRAQLDDLLFKRSNAYSNSKRSEEQHAPPGGPIFNKRRYETAAVGEPNMNKRQKFDLQRDYHTEIIKPQPVLPLKAEHHPEITRRRESSKSNSISPPRRGRSQSSYRHRDGNRSRSSSKGKHHSQGRKRSRERDRSCGSSNKPSRSHNRNQNNDTFHGKDLREILTNRKPKEETVPNGNVSDRNCNTVIKDALNRISSKHDRRISSENNLSNSKYKSDSDNYETTKPCKEIIATGNDGKKTHGKSFINKQEKTATADKRSSSENNHAIKHKPSGFNNSNKYRSMELDSEITQNGAVIFQEAEKLEDGYCKIVTDVAILNKEVNAPGIEEISHINRTKLANKVTCNTPNYTSFSDKKLDVNNSKGSTSESKVATCRQTSTCSELNSDITEGSVNDQAEHNITITNLNSSRTSINASRRKRCVIKIIT